MIGRQNLITCLISDGTLSTEAFSSGKSHLFEKIQIAASAGVSIVQIREKKITTQMLFELAAEAVNLVKGSDTLVFVNDRADVAAAAGADGVHLTTTSPRADEVRRAFGELLKIGVSTHSFDELMRAIGDGADFAVFGPVFPTPGKGPAAGIETLEAVCRSAGRFPVLALGGIGKDNWRRTVSAGAAGFAAIRFFTNFDDGADLADALRI
ncbi:MAG: thiamine phosphate synthase [Pyrinomonadaceae bacterium]|nr:thiamine phosphate synthase [Pyrinomonadaceae bacterium]